MMLFKEDDKIDLESDRKELENSWRLERDLGYKPIKGIEQRANFAKIE